jgi:very-short-patch-repair endonuclease
MVFVAYVKQETGVKLVKEYKFHPKRRWKFDYACPERKIAIEVEGGVWNNGRHTRGKGFIGDIEKYNNASVMGWTLIRVTPDTLLTNETIEFVRQAVDSKSIAKLPVKEISCRTCHWDDVVRYGKAPCGDCFNSSMHKFKEK